VCPNTGPKMGRTLGGRNRPGADCHFRGTPSVYLP
jgi:hypothetical protein